MSKDRLLLAGGAILTAGAIALPLGVVIDEIAQGDRVTCDGPTTFKHPNNRQEYGRPLVQFEIPYPVEIERRINGQRRTFTVTRRWRAPYNGYLEQNVWDDHHVAICELKDENGEIDSLLIQGRNGPPIILENVKHPAQVFYADEDSFRYYRYEDQNFRTVTYEHVNLNTGEIISSETRNVCMSPYACGSW